VAKSVQDLDQAKDHYRNFQQQYDTCILEEKEHYKRMKEFEQAIDLNERLTQQ